MTTSPREIDRPGHPVDEATLASMGFMPFILEIRPAHVDLPGSCEWTTSGDIPKGPGLYAFTVDKAGDLRVMYVGLTEELWMVTKGRLPTGQSRPAQRYGRPRYAGVTRQRVNALVAAQLQQGRLVRHWLRPLENPPGDRVEMRSTLLRMEQELITRWDLRRLGWNRG